MLSSFVPTAVDTSSAMLSVLAFPLVSNLALFSAVLGVSVAIVAVTLHFGEKRQGAPDQQPEALNDVDSAKFDG